MHTWILWEDGVEELVQAHAIAWTKRAVRVRFETPPHMPRLIPLQSSAPDAGRNVQVDSVLGRLNVAHGKTVGPRHLTTLKTAVPTQFHSCLGGSLDMIRGQKAVFECAARHCSCWLHQAAGSSRQPSQLNVQDPRPRTLASRP